MAELSIGKASEHLLADVASALTRGFEGYFVPISIDEEHLLSMVQFDSVDLGESRMLAADGVTAGVALVARRGWTSRLAAMGIVPEWRGKGAGRFLLNALLVDARQRRDREMVLEVIEQNEPAIGLYMSAGFRKVRRLISLKAEGAGSGSADEPEELDIRTLGRLIAMYGVPDLPWQLSSETIAQYAPPFRAYGLNGAYAMISDPDAAQVRFLSLLVEPGARHMGAATRLIQAVLACHPGKNWQVPAIFPEEIVGPFESAGFQRERLAQWQMALRLD